MKSLLIRLQTVSLPVMDNFLKRLVDLRVEDAIPDLLLLFSYESCLSVGSKAFNEKDILKPLDFFQDQGIFLHKSVRGGGLTYYWPGQLICYPLLKLGPHERNIPQYMYNLEEIGLLTLKDFGVSASRKREQAAQIGLWTGEKKIASTGIRVSRWVTSFGMALNLAGDKTPADFIKPCGLDGVKLTTIEENTGVRPTHNEVAEHFTSHFENVYGRKIVKYEQNLFFNEKIDELLNENKLLTELA